MADAPLKFTTTKLPKDLARPLKMRQAETDISIQDQVAIAVTFWEACGAPMLFPPEVAREIKDLIAGHAQEKARKTQPAKQKSSKLG